MNLSEFIVEAHLGDFCIIGVIATVLNKQYISLSLTSYDLYMFLQCLIKTSHSTGLLISGRA